MLFDPPRLATEEDVIRQSLTRKTSRGEFLASKVADGFDWTLTRMVIDDAAVTLQEREEYGITFRDDKPEYNTGRRERWGPGGYDPLRPHRMTEDEWRDSEHFRDGIEFSENMTPVRARYMAEWFDKREYRRALQERRDTSLFDHALGFGAALVGAIPDPINFVALNAGLASKTLGQAALRAARENMILTAAQDALLIPDLASRGEDAGWTDAVFDVAVGGALGGLLGGGAHAMRNTVRRRIPHAAKADAALALEKAVSDLSEGNPVDVGDILRGSAMHREAMRISDEASGIGVPRRGAEPDFTTTARDEPLTLLETRTGAEAETPDGVRLESRSVAEDFPEVRELSERGMLRDADAQAVAEADHLTARVKKWNEGMLSIAECVAGAAV